MGKAEVSESVGILHLLPGLVSRLRFFSLSLVIETRTFSVLVSVSSLRLTSFQSRSCHWDSDLFSLGLVIETQKFSVSVSSLRLRHFQSRSRHWHSHLFSLGLVIETQTFSVLVSVSSLRLRHFQSRSRHWDSDIFSLGLDDQNLVSLIPDDYSCD